MIKKITTILLSVITFISSISIAAFAETTSDNVISVTYTVETGIQTDYYNSGSKWINEMNRYTNKRPVCELLKDVVIENQDGIEFGGQHGGSGIVLDLNGHTLTLNTPYVSLSNYTIKNGTISTDAMLITMTKDEASDDYAIFENVEVDSQEGNVILPAAGTFRLKNCQMNISYVMYGEDTAATGTLLIESGSYKGLDAAPIPTGVALASGSTSTTVAGIADGTTVITSPTTAAIVVKNGMAYTYDDVETATAAQAGGKLLVKNENNEFVEEAKKVTWVIGTDSGVYTAAQDEAERKGMVRFLFNADIAETDIKASGIKCVYGGDITKDTDATLLGSGSAKAFYADVTDIPTTDTGTFYAIAYVTDTAGNTYWSDPVSATVKTNRVFTSID